MSPTFSMTSANVIILISYSIITQYNPKWKHSSTYKHLIIVTCLPHFWPTNLILVIIYRPGYIFSMQYVSDFVSCEMALNYKLDSNFLTNDIFSWHGPMELHLFDCHSRNSLTNVFWVLLTLFRHFVVLHSVNFDILLCSVCVTAISNNNFDWFIKGLWMLSDE